MFRITTQKTRDHTVVTLDGRLADSDVEEVRRVLSSVTAPAALSLSDLETCSEGAVAELLHWMDAGFTLQGATPFMRMLLAKRTGQTTTLNTR
ncbi:MAG: hypothetical protein WCK89_21795 [bacterium]